jgi:hypothetical protein
MILCAAVTGCSGNPKDRLPPPSTERLDLSVALPGDCRALASAVAHPPMRKDDDAEVIVLRYAAALELANATIGAQSSCLGELVTRYRSYAAGEAQGSPKKKQPTTAQRLPK